MATIAIASVSIPGGTHLKSGKLSTKRRNSLGNTLRLTTLRKLNDPQANRKLSVHAESSDRTSGGGDFVAGFLVGGALFGTLAYVFAPQIRRSILNEDQHGFRRPRRLVYYDDGLEKTRETLNAKIRQLNSAIDNVSSLLRGLNNKPPVPIESDPEEATM